MSSIYDKKPYKEYILNINDCNSYAEGLPNIIKGDFSNKEETGKFNILYIYSLKDKKFLYPNNESDVLYIGHTYGEKKKTKRDLGFRFKHCMNGNDNKQNICLGNYYNKGYILKLELFDIKEDDCKEIENELRYKFLNTYGALPIADGAAYDKKKVEKTSDTMEEE